MMKELIERHYEATRKRGLINENTGMGEFIDKMQEELDEIANSYHVGEFSDSIEETIDLIAVCLNTLEHFGYDFERKYKRNVEYQEQRSLN
jgi:NTP pyrophosphatase (non-canonical NTP hydrolase)